MALPSQNERTGDAGRAVSYKPSTGGPSRTPLLVAGVLVVAAAGAGIYWLSTVAGKPAEAGATPGKLSPGPSGGDRKGADGLSKLPGTPGPANNTPAVKPLAETPPAPVQISLGSERRGSVTTPTSQPQPGPTNPPANPSSNPGAAPPSTPSGSPSAAPGAGQPHPTGPGTPPAPSGGQPNSPSSNPGTTPPPGETGKPTGVDVTDPNASKPGTQGQPSGQPNSPQGPANPIPATGSTSDVMMLIAEGDRKQKANDLVGARASFSKAMLNPKCSATDQDSLRTRLTTINQDLVFSAKVYAGDPMCEEYAVESGDGLQKIAKKRGLVTDWRLIERINKADSSKLKIGQKLKLVRGPFHAVVNKAAYRLDLYWGVPTDPENWLYIRSFKVGLGQNTPVGEFTVKTGSKQVNPPWTNPVTGEKFGADDPKNPIGERWVGIEGKGDAAKFKGFGIHGTIEPDSVGQSKSMGCVRMLSDDINLVYEVLMDPVSVVKLVP